MTTLHLTVGLPASGKTTWAKQLLEARDVGSIVRVNRDDLRLLLHNQSPHIGITEQQVTKAAHSLIRAFLADGMDVVVDDTNLRDKHLRQLVKLGLEVGAEIHIEDFTDVPLDVCLNRDARRDRPVGERVIREMHARSIRGRGPRCVEHFIESSPLVFPYVADQSKPKVILVDIDGTVALMNGRGPFEWMRVGEDEPNWPVVEAVNALYAAGYEVIFMSGRDEICRPETQKWLATYFPWFAGCLFMRRRLDNRKDSVVKLELFNEHIRDRYHVVAVFDDRQQVVDMWRSLGLTVMQVAEGKF